MVSQNMKKAVSAKGHRRRRTEDETISESVHSKKARKTGEDRSSDSDEVDSFATTLSENRIAAGKLCEQGLPEVQDDDGKNAEDGTSESGCYNKDSKEWVWDCGKDLRLRVGVFRGKPFVDIRHLWQGHPTKKGFFLTPQIFERIQNWPKLQDALRTVQETCAARAS